MALSDLALTHHFEAVFGWGGNIAESYARCGEAARRAVAIDDSDANAHTALAIFDLFSGRHEEGRRRARRALDLDPNSAFTRGYIGTSYAFAGEYDVALSWCDEATGSATRPAVIIWTCEGLGRRCFPSAIGSRRVHNRGGRSQSRVSRQLRRLGAAHGHLAEAVAARAALDELLRRMPGLTAADERLGRPFGSAAQRERFLEGLRQGRPAGGVIAPYGSGAARSVASVSRSGGSFSRSPARHGQDR